MFLFVSTGITVSVEQCCKLLDKNSLEKKKKKTAKHAMYFFYSCLDPLVCSPNEHVFMLSVMLLYACVWVDGGRGCHLHYFLSKCVQRDSKRKKQERESWCYRCLSVCGA